MEYRFKSGVILMLTEFLARGDREIHSDHNTVSQKRCNRKEDATKSSPST